jgi:hypothetical protein
MIDQDAVRFRWVFERRDRQIQPGWPMDVTKLYDYNDIYEWRDEVDRLMEQETPHVVAGN